MVGIRNEPGFNPTAAAGPSKDSILGIAHHWLYAFFSLSCLGISRVDFHEILSQIVSLDWKFVTIAVLFDLSVYVVHGWRWNVLLSPLKRLGLWRTVQSIYIGLFANEVLPLRTGELIRCYLLAHWNDLHLSVVIASAAMERLIDGFWMVAAFIVTASFLTLPGYLVDGVRVLGGLLLLGAAVVAWIIFHKQHAHAVVRESRWATTLRHVVEGLHTMGKWHSLTRTALISLLYLVLQIIPVWALMRGYEMDLSMGAAAAVLILLRVGTLIPNAPGNVGLYQATCVLALGLFGVDKTTATGFSVIMFMALTFPLLIGGALAVMLTGLNITEIRHRAHRGLQATRTPPTAPRPAPENR